MSTSSLVLTKRFGDQTILASPKPFETQTEAAEEALNISGGGVLEQKGDEITVYSYLKEPTKYRIAPAADSAADSADSAADSSHSPVSIAFS